ncbi:hypothetical protein NQ317_014620 [Molorchus minor]|uniref:WAP domain-containing protein n=1 Tax=Molorchus minor TaxID=1323400 RepID=A0ABQ9J2Z2_9CUCU|nr:hypothetical protein NQ317_014620 [Molorchus minor]
MFAHEVRKFQFTQWKRDILGNIIINSLKLALSACFLKCPIHLSLNCSNVKEAIVASLASGLIPTMIQELLILLILPAVFSYYFYNPATNDILAQSSLKNVPKGYVLIQPPKNNRRFRKGKRPGRCTNAGFTCSSPFDRSLTFQYECDDDNQCPVTYKCCQQQCFVHKICSKAVTADNNNGNGNFNRPGVCEKWPYNCQSPYDFAVSSTFQCNSDRQCPRNFKCCEQNCFSHRICSRIATDTRQSDVNYTKIAATTEMNIHNTHSHEYYHDIDQITSTTENVKVDIEDIEDNNYNETEDRDNVQTTEDISAYNFDTETKKDFDDTTELENDLTELTTSTSKHVTPDSNAINPEYEAYYYHYGESNETNYDDYEDDYDNEDEDDQ